MKTISYIYTFLIIVGVERLKNSMVDLGKLLKISNDKYDFLYSRPLSAVTGIVLLLTALGLYRKYKPVYLFVYIIILFYWLYFVISGTIKTIGQYKQPQSILDTLLFAAIIAVATSPVFGWMAWNWKKQRDYFYNKDECRYKNNN